MTSSTKIGVGLSPPQRVNIVVRSGTNHQITLQSGGGTGTRNYNNLVNRPSINGIVLQGNLGVADLNIVCENTAEEWAAIQTTYIPKQGEIVVYSDTGRIKVGDGSVPLVDLPYIGEDDLERVSDALTGHINDTAAHVSAEDRLRWDNKLNYDVSGENLTFTRM